MKSFGLGLFAWTIIIFISFIVSPIAFAADPTPVPNGTPCTTPNGNGGQVEGALTDFGCIPYEPGAFVQRFYGIGLGFIGGTALLVIIYGGYLLMTSQGNPDQIRSGKNAIYYSILGVLLAIFGYLFVEVIAVDVLRIPGFS